MKSIFLILIIAFCSSATALSQYMYQTTSGTVAYEKAQAVFVGFDQSAFVVGTRGSSAAGRDQIILLRIDASGTTLWQKELGITGVIDAGFAIDGVDDDADGFKDDGIIIVGQTASYAQSSGEIDLFVVKLDYSGNIIWQTVIGTEDFVEYPVSVIQTHDEGFLIAGQVEILPSTSYAYVLKLDSLGGLGWTKVLSFSFSSEAQAFEAFECDDDSDGLFDDAFVICGGQQPAGGGSDLPWAVKLDLQGDVVWSKTYDANSLPPYSFFTAAHKFKTS